MLDALNRKISEAGVGTRHQASGTRHQPESLPASRLPPENLTSCSPPLGRELSLPGSRRSRGEEGLRALRRSRVLMFMTGVSCVQERGWRRVWRDPSPSPLRTTVPPLLRGGVGNRRTRLLPTHARPEPRNQHRPRPSPLPVPFSRNAHLLLHRYSAPLPLLLITSLLRRRSMS